MASIKVLEVKESSNEEHSIKEEGKEEEEEVFSQGARKKPLERPKLKIWRLFLLCGMIFANDMGYGIELAYAIPLVVAAGLDIAYASILLTISPFVGLLIHSYLGSASDGCKCRWGRRRPFILLLAITIIVGCIISPFSPLISKLNFRGSVVMGVILTGLGVLILDLSLGQLQLPTRALILDVVPISQVERANFMAVIVAGIGACIGFAMGGVDWTKLLKLEGDITTGAQIFFPIGILITIVCLLCTLFSVKETPAIFTIEEEEKKCSCCSVSNLCCQFYSMSIESVKFIFHLSRDMWILWFAVLFGFTSDFCLGLFFTSFVGEVVYGGDSSAPEDSELYQLYIQGVQTGSFGLAGSFLMMTVSMVLSDQLTKYFGLKSIFLTVQYCYVIALFAMMFLTNVPAVIILVSFYGPFVGTFLSFPYILIGVYKEKSLMFRKPWHGASDAIEGRACFFVNSALFSGQCIAVLVTGPIIDLAGTSSAAITISCITGAIALVFARLCKVPSND